METPWRQSRRLARLLDAALANPRATIAIWALVALLGISGLAQIEIDTSTNSFLDRGDPAWEIYQRSLAQYGGDELLVVALEGDSAWSASSLDDVVRLSNSFAGIAGVRRVDSLATVPLIRTMPDGDLRLDSGLAGGVPSTPAEWDRYRDWLAGDRLAPNSLVSGDGRVFAINLLLDRKIVGDRVGVVEAVRGELDGLKTWVTGVPVFRTEVNSRTLEQIAVFVPLTLLALGCVLMLALRCIQALVVAFSVGGVGAACALGALGPSAVPLSLTTTMLPSLVLALGCAYSMHVLTAALGRRDETALRVGLQRVMRPIALSGVTTVIGFLAMATIPVSAIRELATYGALGVFVATLAALTLGPAILVLWPMEAGGTRPDAWIRGPLRRALIQAVVRGRRTVIIVWGLLAIGVGSGLGQLFYATDIIQWFPRGEEVREEYESVRERLSGITPVNVVIESADPMEEADVTSPETLAAIDALASALQARGEVGKAVSVADPLRQIHAAMTGDLEAGLPGDYAVISQYLLLLESVDYMRDVLRIDHGGGNILLRLDDNASSRIVDLGEWVADWWAEHGIPELAVTTTGIMYEFGRSEEQIARGQVRGLVLAFGIVGLILLAVFRDVRMAALGLAVNAVPLGVIFGGLGMAGIGLDAATACIGSTALGIGVDDTIHVLTGYREQRLRGESRSDAIDGCLARVLPALVFTTLTIGIGFLVLLLSPFTLVVNLGWVTAAIVVLCLLADTTLLPALLTSRNAVARGESTAVSLSPETENP